MIPEYCDQYDPNQDFAIFQVGNGATGGVMNLQEKMNVADNVNNSSDEDDTAAPKSTSVANKLSLANSTNSSGEFIKSRPSSSGSSSNSQKRLTFDSLPPNGQDLPEDREIISELGEEEEEDCWEALENPRRFLYSWVELGLPLEVGQFPHFDLLYRLFAYRQKNIKITN